MAQATAPERARVSPAPAPERSRVSPAPARVPDRQPRRALETPGTRGPRWSLPRTAALGGLIVLVSLLMVVAASAYMTQGQVSLTRMQGELNSVLGQHHLLENQVASLSDPSGVVSQSQHHGLVAPTNVTDLNQVNPSASSTTAATTPTSGHASVHVTGGP
ncbi:MAG TPA: hypothetical protein VII76_12710 [Acidimicrobiales bacterium]